MTHITNKVLKIYVRAWSDEALADAIERTEEYIEECNRLRNEKHIHHVAYAVEVYKSRLPIYEEEQARRKRSDE